MQLFLRKSCLYAFRSGYNCKLCAGLNACATPSLRMAYYSTIRIGFKFDSSYYEIPFSRIKHLLRIMSEK